MKDLPIRYPFCDVFIYVYKKEDNSFHYRDTWGEWVKAGLRSMDLSGGTKLIPFGDFEMRISVDTIRYLNESGYPNWKRIGVTQWYNHFLNWAQTEYKFQLLPRLYSPALPFRLE